MVSPVDGEHMAFPCHSACAPHQAAGPTPCLLHTMSEGSGVESGTH